MKKYGNSEKINHLRSAFIGHMHINLLDEAKARSVARSCAVNLALIVIYEGKVRRTWRTTGFMHVNISVRRYFSSFGRTPSSGMKAAQSFIHEAPFIFFERNILVPIVYMQQSR